MQDTLNLSLPSALQRIVEETERLAFRMASAPLTGALLRTLAASKPGGAFLELGTGTGLSTAWLLDGMDAASTLLTVDNDARVVAVAQRHLGHDPRVTFHVADGSEFLVSLHGRQFDLVFADTWPGKYEHLPETLALLKPGAFYIIDDMLPQESWPEGHAAKVPVLIKTLEDRDDLRITKMCWSTGLILAVKTSPPKPWW